MNDIKMLKISVNDARFLNKLMNDKFIKERLHEIKTTTSVWKSAITEWEKDADEEGYIIYENEIPIGWLGINGLLSVEKQAYIKMLVLLPEYHGKGIGTYILSEALKDLHTRGYKKASLYTDLDNIAARKCYEKCGFVVTKNLISKMSDGKNVERIRMEVNL